MGALAVLSAPHNYGRICLWNAGMYSTNGLWATLRGVVPGRVLFSPKHYLCLPSRGSGPGRVLFSPKHYLCLPSRGSGRE